MNDEIMVSVGCITYNQEKYIRKCLDGLVMQKTTFKYEIVIHDDASTDDTADIIREYESKYPDLIKPIYETENQYSKGVKLGKEIMNPLMKGKYLAVCEGDDYWCDEYKLQKQFDVMENNPNCHLCVHRVQAINSDGTINEKQYPNKSLASKTFSSEDFMKYIGCQSYPFQTSSYFRRLDDVNEYNNNPPEFVRISDTGDVVALMYLGSIGDVCYIDEIMSCYRLSSNGSWTQSMMQDFKKKLDHAKLMVKVYDLFFEYTDNKFNYYFENQRRNYYLDMCALSCENPKNARELLKKRNRYYIKKMSLKNIIYILTCAYLPFFGKLYKKIKD